MLSILALHAIAIATACTLGIAQVTVEHPALLVRLISSPSRAVEPQPSVPAPRLQAPSLRVPAPRLQAPSLRVPAPIIEIAPALQVDSPVIATAAVTQPSPSRESAPVPTPSMQPSLVEPPRFDLAYLENPAPPYPTLSRRTREEGRVLLRVRVDADGRVETIAVHATSGHPRLDEAALEAVRRWRFAPARSGDRRVAGWAVVPINFHLSG